MAHPPVVDTQPTQVAAEDDRFIIKSQTDSKSCFAKYHEYGFAIIKDLFPADVVAALQEEITQIFRISDPDFQDVHTSCARLDRTDQDRLYRIYLAVSRARSFTELMLRCADNLRETFAGNGPTLFVEGKVLFGLPRDDRLTYDWHQETPAYDGVNADIFTFWCPVFERATQEIGTMSVLVGSHTRGALAFEKIKKPKGYTDYVPHGISELATEYEEYDCVCNPGDAVLLHGLTVHRSNYNPSDRTRFSAALRYIMPDRLPDKFVFSAA